MIETRSGYRYPLAVVAFSALILVRASESGEARSERVPQQPPLRRVEPLRLLRLDSAALGGRGGVLSIERIASLRSGGIVVLDRVGLQIAVLDQSGVVRDLIGRAGQGPGEFSRAVSFVVTTGDTILVPDVANARVNRFLRNGTSLEAIPLTPAGLPVWYGQNSRGTLLEAYRQLRVINGLGSFRTTISIRQLPQSDAAPVTLDFGLRDSLEQSRLFSPMPSIDLMPGDRFLAGTGKLPEVRVFSPRGPLQRTIPLRLIAPRIAPDDREVLLQHLLAAVPAATRARVAADVLNRVGFEQAYPYYTALLYDGASRIWLQLPATTQRLRSDSMLMIDADHLGSSEWAVVDTVGNYLFRVQMPPSHRLKAVRLDTLFAAVERGSGAIELATLLVR